MFLHEYASHTAVRFHTFKPFDDGWMFHATCRFLRLAVADDTDNPYLSEFQGKAAESFPLSAICDDEAEMCARTAVDFADFLIRNNKPNLFFPITLRMYADAAAAGDDDAVRERMCFFMANIRTKIKGEKYRKDRRRAIRQGVDAFIRFLEDPL